MQTTTTIKKVNPSAVCKQRVQAVKHLLPKNYKQIILSNYPAYNTAKGASLIANVISGRTAELLLTEILERIANGELKLRG